MKFLFTLLFLGHVSLSVLKPVEQNEDLLHARFLPHHGKIDDSLIPAAGFNSFKEPTRFSDRYFSFIVTFVRPV